MEYMASGTPALMTRLPGMPEEYLEYVYILEDESIEGMAGKLKEVLNFSQKENMEKGRKAKEYVLKEKSNKNQAERVMKWLGY